MPTFEIQPIQEADLHDVAEFVHRSRHLSPDSDQQASEKLGLTPDDYFQGAFWRTQINPARPAEMELGHAIRRDDGAILGVHLLSPFKYRWGNRRLLALGSGSYYADAEVRFQAFFLFKRFLAIPGFDFYFANTANLYSGRVWEKCGGRAAPESEFTWIVPLRLGPLVREVLVRRGRRKLAQLAATASRWVELLPGRSISSRLQLQPTDDLQFLVETAERFRNRDQLVPDRDLPYLRWQYVDGQAILPKELFRFHDAQGRDGWVAVGSGPAGIDGRLNLATVLDWVAPSELDFATVVRAVARRFASTADAIVFRKRPGMSLEARLPRLRRRRYASPKSYLIPADRKEQGWERTWVSNQIDSV